MLSNAQVYVVDDDPAARDALAALVGEMGVAVKTYPSAEDFLRDYNGHRPGCLVTDVRMLGMSGVELQEQLLRDGISLSVIVLTAHADTPITIRAIKQGAVTLLEKPCRNQELWDAIRLALREDVDKTRRDRRINEIRRRLALLTPAERRVLEQMVAGKPNKVMAKELKVSVRTIEVRRQSIFHKMLVDSLAELVRDYLEIRPPANES